MSAVLTQRIAFRELAPHHKSVLLALANYAREDGTGARPALKTLAQWTGRSWARTRVVVRELRRLGLITVTRAHAQHRPAEYALVLPAIEALPSARREPQQLDLFAVDLFGQAGDAQGFAREHSGVRRFPQISTGVHRSPAITRLITGDHRSVYRDPCTGIPVPGAREKTGTG
jgi:hypothetical protein